MVVAVARTARYVFTPARRAALRKAQLASARARRQSNARRHAKSIGKAAIRGGAFGGPAGAAAGAGHRALGIASKSVRRKARNTVAKPVAAMIPGQIGKPKRRHYISRGYGLKGLKRNTIPYARVNVRHATVGVNAGTVIPGTGKRVVLGGYVRVETARKYTKVESAIAGRKAKAIPVGSKRAKAYAIARRHKLIPKNPATRIGISGSQARLGTSRKGGPTVIVRRGPHKVSRKKSRSAIAKYDRRMRTISGKKVKKARPQRRKAASKKKR